MQERAKKTRDAILQAAVRTFARNGYHGTKIDAIAAAAEVNKQRIYAYFGSKARLFEAALREVFERVNAEERRLEFFDRPDPAQLTLKLLRHYLDIHRRHPEMHRMIAWANLELRQSPSWLSDIKEETFARLRETYRLGQEQGVFNPGVSFEVYIFTLTALTGFYVTNRLTASRTIAPELFTADGQGLEKLIGEAAVLLQLPPRQ